MIADNSPESNPWVTCPRCSEPSGAPVLNGRQGYPCADQLACTSCGHRWREESLEKVAQAWRADVAHERREDNLWKED